MVVCVSRSSFFLSSINPCCTVLNDIFYRKENLLLLLLWKKERCLLVHITQSMLLVMAYAYIRHDEWRSTLSSSVAVATILMIMVAIFFPFALLASLKTAGKIIVSDATKSITNGNSSRLSTSVRWHYQTERYNHYHAEKMLFSLFLCSRQYALFFRMKWL